MKKCIYPFSLFKGIQVTKTKRAGLHGVFLGFNPTMNIHQTNVIWIYKVGFVETLLQDPTEWLWERVDMHTAANHLHMQIKVRLPHCIAEPVQDY